MCLRPVLCRMTGKTEHMVQDAPSHPPLLVHDVCVLLWGVTRGRACLRAPRGLRHPGVWLERLAQCDAAEHGLSTSDRRARAMRPGMTHERHCKKPCYEILNSDDSNPAPEPGTRTRAATGRRTLSVEQGFPTVASSTGNESNWAVSRYYQQSMPGSPQAERVFYLYLPPSSVRIAAGA